MSCLLWAKSCVHEHGTSAFYFLLFLYDSGEQRYPFFVLVQNSGEASFKHEALNILCEYNITGLRKSTLTPDSIRVDINLCVKRTRIEPACDSGSGMMAIPDVAFYSDPGLLNAIETEMDEKMCSYEGVVTKCISKVFGIYEVDEDSWLITTYLQNGMNGGLPVGAHVKIYHAHIAVELVTAVTAMTYIPCYYGLIEAEAFEAVDSRMGFWCNWLSQFPPSDLVKLMECYEVFCRVFARNSDYHRCRLFRKIIACHVETDKDPVRIPEEEFLLHHRADYRCPCMRPSRIDWSVFPELKCMTDVRSHFFEEFCGELGFEPKVWKLKGRMYVCSGADASSSLGRDYICRVIAPEGRWAMQGQLL